MTVAAPGVDLVGFGSTGEFVSGLAGSAFAAALVAGTVADLRTRYPELTPFDLRQRLIASADRPGPAVPDRRLGWGVINPVTALTAPLGDAEQTAGSTEQSSAAVAAVVVDLPPAPADNSWSVAVAVLLLVLAAGLAAVRRGSARRSATLAAGCGTGCAGSVGSRFGRPG